MPRLVKVMLLVCMGSVFIVVSLAGLKGLRIKVDSDNELMEVRTSGKLKCPKYKVLMSIKFSYCRLTQILPLLSRE